MSSRLIASASSSGVCVIRGGCAWSIPIATEKRMTPPAIWNAPIVIEKNLKRSEPQTAKASSTAKAMIEVLRASWRLASGG